MENKNDVKICILCLCSHHQIFQYQVMVDKNTWIKHAQEEGIDVYRYEGSNRNEIIDDIIYCDCEDDFWHTYEKTICAFQQLDIDKYDFVVRTNLTTYINPKILIQYCQFLKDNNYNIANGCLCIKDNIINYRGNSLILDNMVCHYLLDHIHPNTEHVQDDGVFQEVFKNIDNLKIHSVPFRYYCKEEYFKYHPQTIKEITKENLEGIVFISYRITEINKINTDKLHEKYRYIELGRCYEIDSVYNQLENNSIKDNFGLIYDGDINKFKKNINTIIQQNNQLQYIC